MAKGHMWSRSSKQRKYKLTFFHKNSIRNILEKEHQTFQNQTEINIEVAEYLFLGRTPSTWSLTETMLCLTDTHTNTSMHACTHISSLPKLKFLNYS